MSSGKQTKTKYKYQNIMLTIEREIYTIERTIYFIHPSGKLKLSFDRTTKNIFQ